jgi:DNA-binding transcriptional LysR family regulator
MNNSLGLREALLHEAGVTLTPTFVVGEDIRQGQLQAILPDYKVLEVKHLCSLSPATSSVAKGAGICGVH